MSKTKAQLEAENEAQRAMLAAQREEIEALYDIFAAIGESSANANWIVGYAGSIVPESPSLLRRYAAAIRAKDAPPNPDPGACTCGHPGYEHLYARPGPCTQCDCKAFGAPVPDEAAAAGLCQYCDVEPAIAGNYCEACAAAVELATGTPVIVEDDACSRRPTPTSTLSCDLPAGHKGEVHEVTTDSAVIRWNSPVTGEDLFDAIAAVNLDHAS